MLELNEYYRSLFGPRCFKVCKARQGRHHLPKIEQSGWVLHEELDQNNFDK